MCQHVEQSKHSRVASVSLLSAIQNVSIKYIYEIGQLVRRYDVTITQPAADQL